MNTKLILMMIITSFSLQGMDLHEAARLGNTEKIQELLAAGTAIDSRDSCGNTPLHEASRKGHAQVMLLLLNARADVDSLDHCNNTPLYMASSNGHTPVVQLLLAAGAWVNSQNHCGNTPLHGASLCGEEGVGQMEVVQMLLAAGAKPHIKNWRTCPILGTRLHKKAFQVARGDGVKKVYRKHFIKRALKEPICAEKNGEIPENPTHRLPDRVADLIVEFAEMSIDTQK